MQTPKKMQFGTVTGFAGCRYSRLQGSHKRGSGHAWQRVRCGPASVRLWFREAGVPSGGHAVPAVRTSGVRLHALLPLDWWPWDVGLQGGVLRLWRYWCGFLTAHLLGFDEGRSWWAKFRHFLTLFTLQVILPRCWLQLSRTPRWQKLTFLGSSGVICRSYGNGHGRRH